MQKPFESKLISIYKYISAWVEEFAIQANPQDKIRLKQSWIKIFATYSACYKMSTTSFLAWEARVPKTNTQHKPGFEKHFQFNYLF